MVDGQNVQKDESKIVSDKSNINANVNKTGESIAVDAIVTTKQVPARGLVRITAGPFSQRGDGKFFGNDIISFAWTSDGLGIPKVILYNSQGIAVHTKNLTPGIVASSVKLGESIGGNLNLPTGSYKIAICDYANPASPVCDSTAYFAVTATTTPFQP